MSDTDSISPTEVDFSVIRTSIDMGHSMIDQILNGIHYGSEEIRRLLREECDFIMECKVCRNLFRSFANFVAHKRVYCSESIEDRELIDDIAAGEVETVVVQPESPENRTKQTNKGNRNDSVIDKVVNNTHESNSKEYQLYTKVAEKIVQAKSTKVTNTLTLTEIPTTSAAVTVEYSKGDKSNEKDPKSGESQQLRSSEATTDTKKKKSTLTEVCSSLLQRQSGTSTSGNIPKGTNSNSLVLPTQSDRTRKSVPKKFSEDTARPGTSSKTPMEIDDDVPEWTNSSNQNKQTKPGLGVSEGKKYSPEKMETSPEPQQTEKEWFKFCDFDKLQCTECGKTFSHVDSLKLHARRLHWQKESYKCPICKKDFSWFRSVERHLRTIHNRSEQQISEYRKKMQVRNKIVEVLTPESKSKLQLSKSSTSLWKGWHKCENCQKYFSKVRTYRAHLKTRVCYKAKSNMKNVEKNKTDDANVSPSSNSGTNNSKTTDINKNIESADNASTKVKSPKTKESDNVYYEEKSLDKKSMLYNALTSPDGNPPTVVYVYPKTPLQDANTEHNVKETSKSKDTKGKAAAKAIPETSKDDSTRAVVSSRKAEASKEETRPVGGSRKSIEKERTPQTDINERKTEKKETRNSSKERNTADVRNSSKERNTTDVKTKSKDAQKTNEELDKLKDRLMTEATGKSPHKQDAHGWWKANKAKGKDSDGKTHSTHSDKKLQLMIKDINKEKTPIKSPDRMSASSFRSSETSPVMNSPSSVSYPNSPTSADGYSHKFKMSVKEMAELVENAALTKFARERKKQAQNLLNKKKSSKEGLSGKLQRPMKRNIRGKRVFPQIKSYSTRLASGSKNVGNKLKDNLDDTARRSRIPQSGVIGERDDRDSASTFHSKVIHSRDEDTANNEIQPVQSKRLSRELKLLANSAGFNESGYYETHSTSGSSTPNANYQTESGQSPDPKMRPVNKAPRDMAALNILKQKLMAAQKSVSNSKSVINKRSPDKISIERYSRTMDEPRERRESRSSSVSSTGTNRSFRFDSPEQRNRESSSKAVGGKDGKSGTVKHDLQDSDVSMETETDVSMETETDVSLETETRPRTRHIDDESGKPIRRDTPSRTIVKDADKAGNSDVEQNSNKGMRTRITVASADESDKPTRRETPSRTTVKDADKSVNSDVEQDSNKSIKTRTSVASAEESDKPTRRERSVRSTVKDTDKSVRSDVEEDSNKPMKTRTSIASVEDSDKPARRERPVRNTMKDADKAENSDKEKDLDKSVKTRTSVTSAEESNEFKEKETQDRNTDKDSGKTVQNDTPKAVVEQGSEKPRKTRTFVVTLEESDESTRRATPVRTTVKERDADKADNSAVEKDLNKPMKTRTSVATVEEPDKPAREETPVRNAEKDSGKNLLEDTPKATAVQGIEKPMKTRTSASTVEETEHPTSKKTGVKTADKDSHKTLPKDTPKLAVVKVSHKRTRTSSYTKVEDNQPTNKETSVRNLQRENKEHDLNKPKEKNNPIVSEGKRASKQIKIDAFVITKKQDLGELKNSTSTIESKDSESIKPNTRSSESAAVVEPSKPVRTSTPFRDTDQNSDKSLKTGTPVGKVDHDSAKPMKTRTSLNTLSKESEKSSTESPNDNLLSKAGSDKGSTKSDNKETTANASNDTTKATTKGAGMHRTRLSTGSIFFDSELLKTSPSKFDQTEDKTENQEKKVLQVKKKLSLSPTRKATGKLPGQKTAKESFFLTHGYFICEHCKRAFWKRNRYREHVRKCARQQANKSTSNSDSDGVNMLDLRRKRPLSLSPRSVDGASSADSQGNSDFESGHLRKRLRRKEDAFSSDTEKLENNDTIQHEIVTAEANSDNNQYQDKIMTNKTGKDTDETVKVNSDIHAKSSEKVSSVKSDTPQSTKVVHVKSDITPSITKNVLINIPQAPTIHTVDVDNKKTENQLREAGAPLSVDEPGTSTSFLDDSDNESEFSGFSEVEEDTDLDTTKTDVYDKETDLETMKIDQYDKDTDLETMKVNQESEASEEENPIGEVNEKDNVSATAKPCNSSFNQAGVTRFCSSTDYKVDENSVSPENVGRTTRTSNQKNRSMRDRKKSYRTMYRSYVCDSDKRSKMVCQVSGDIDKIVDTVNLVCKHCDSKHTNVSNLRQHAIRHLGWKRYKCNLCTFSNYIMSELKLHLSRKHCIKGSDIDIKQYVSDLKTEARNKRISKRSNTLRQHKEKGISTQSSPDVYAKPRPSMSATTTKAGRNIKRDSASLVSTPSPSKIDERDNLLTSSSGENSVQNSPLSKARLRLANVLKS